MSLGLGQSLPSIVQAKYRSAKAAEALTFASTQLAVVSVGEASYELRYCPSLSQKPQPNHPTPSPSPSTSAHAPKPKPKSDPFANPDPHLHIVDLPHDSPYPTHFLVLNKYPIIPHHFILATKAHKPQTHSLEERDISLTYSLLCAWDTAEKRKDKLFAFFNSGPHSGASQAHRHVQFLPVEAMRDGNAGGEWSLLLDKMKDASSGTPAGTSNKEDETSPFVVSKDVLPFTAIAATLPSNPSPAQLHQTYTTLYSASEQAARAFLAAHPDHPSQLHPTDTGNLPISYNMGLTTTTMVICPRMAEGASVRLARGDGSGRQDDNSESDYVALNGTLLGGTLLVKREATFNTLRSEPQKLHSVLEAIGVPHGAAQQPQGRPQL